MLRASIETLALGLGILLFLCIGRSIAAQNSSVYEILPKFGLPMGLLPDGVANYTISTDGMFTVMLEKPCYVEFEYLVYYEPVISGRIGYGSITELSGIQVKRFFLWFNVDDIKVDLPPADFIYFQVGIICKRLDMAQFQSVHSCRSDNTLSRNCHRDPLLQLATTAEDGLMLITE